VTADRNGLTARVGGQELDWPAEGPDIAELLAKLHARDPAADRFARSVVGALESAPQPTTLDGLALAIQAVIGGRAIDAVDLLLILSHYSAGVKRQYGRRGGKRSKLSPAQRAALELAVRAPGATAADVQRCLQLAGMAVSLPTIRKHLRKQSS